MGNVTTSYIEQNDEDRFWLSDVRSLVNKPENSERISGTINADTRVSQKRNFASTKPDLNENAPKKLSEDRTQQLNEFKLELARKHEKRRIIIEEKHKEMEELQVEIIKLKEENEKLKFCSKNSLELYQTEEVDRLRKENEDMRNLLKEKSSIIEESEIVVKKNHELRMGIVEMQKDLQRLNTEVINFEQERADYQRHVVALKDVIAVSKNMLQIRESQLKELKEKVEAIENSLADRQVTVMSDDLRQEYERQIANMRHLRVLYEDRQRAERREKEELESQMDDVKTNLEQQNKKSSELEERISQLEEDNSKKYDEIKQLESNLGLAKAENRQFQDELSVINQLFSETLLRYNTTQELDLDKLQKNLEDHHDLLKDIVVNEVCSEVSYALPKVLLDLINQLHSSKDDEVNVIDQQLLPVDDRQEYACTTRHQMNSAEEIVENLPKVWKVLIELLSHQVVPNNVLTEDEKTSGNPCYKKIETAKGPSLVLSVSQTFIRLKDLILEKKSLEKETSHLKHLNCHLENRLQDQEKRLEMVQNELSKTWLVVGKLQKQHQMLHTQEKILRYELAQKRKLLTELKAELEYSREKCAQAREKNISTEEQWKQLRSEFANRRLITLEDLNNSAESGYSEDREGSSDDEPGYETDVSECDKKNSVKEKYQDLKDTETERDNHSNLEEVISPATEKYKKQKKIVNNINSSHTDSGASGNKSAGAMQKEIESLPKKFAETATSVIPRTNSRAERRKVETIVTVERIDDCISPPRQISLNNKHSISSFKDITQSSSTEEETNTYLAVNTTSEDNLRNKSESPNEAQKQESPILTAEAKQSGITQTFATIKATENVLDKPSTSRAAENMPLEEILARREERLKRLEGQATSLVTQAEITANRSLAIVNKLDSIHEFYGESSENGDNQTEDDKTGENSENKSNIE